MEKTIYDYLEMISRRPWMYIWANSIKYLFLNLVWFKNFIWFNDLKVNESLPFDLFHEYIGLVLWYKSIWWMWWSTMLIKEYWDTKEWLDKFFEHLDEFKEKFWKMEEKEIIKYFDERWYDVRSRFE